MAQDARFYPAFHFPVQPLDNGSVYKRWAKLGQPLPSMTADRTGGGYPLEGTTPVWWLGGDYTGVVPSEGSRSALPSLTLASAHGCDARRRHPGRAQTKATRSAILRNAKSRTKPKNRPGASPELRVTSVISRPAPDAEDRLRRLFTLLLKPPASDGEAAFEEQSPLDDRRNSQHPEEEA